MLSETDDKLVLMFADFIFSKLNTHFFEHELDSYIEKAEKLREKRISRAQGRDYSKLLVFNTLARCEMNAYLSFNYHNPTPFSKRAEEEGGRGKSNNKKKNGKRKSKRKNNKERLIGSAVDLFIKDQLRKTNYYRKGLLKFNVLLKYRVDDFIITTEADLFIRKKNYLIELKHSKELRAFDYEHLNFLSLFTDRVFVINTYTREVLRFEQTERERQELIEKLDRVVKAVKTQNPASLRPNLAFCWFCDRKFSCPIFRSMRQISSKL